MQRPSSQHLPMSEVKDINYNNVDLLYIYIYILRREGFFLVTVDIKWFWQVALLHKYSWVTFHLWCMSYLPALLAVIKHVQNLHAEVTVQMPTPLKPVFELKNGFGDKYRWLVLTLLNGWIHSLSQQVAGVWGWQICAFCTSWGLRELSSNLCRRAQ